ncbi:hypothetical protein C2E21_3200 [Chlorella sorokiniana]|uniref:RAP domain n=1 Tax=Chlorella sorokiniana TaxID=3076 RepID=A0A2P6TWK0_CHLSO|nr:hypothetical protein C2E21_3200 [Chlorella sorokiniana]|eukprot:PRW58441.1 hypothetical protein C2E21_3200 [Chlorella sorokiniana]
MQRPYVLVPANADRKGAAAAGGGKPVPPPPPAAPSGETSPPIKGPAPGQAPAEDDMSPLSKFKDWHSVEALKGEARPPLPLPLPALPLRGGGPPAERVQAAGRARRPALAADVAQLVDTILSHVGASSGPAPTAAAGKPVAGKAGPAAPAKPAAAAAKAPSSSNSMAACLEVLAAPDALALATDTTLTTLLNGLHPLLHYSPATRQWGTPGLGALLAALQVSCEERLRRSTLPCDSALAAATARLFVRVVKEAGSASLGGGLLAAAAGFVMAQSRALSGEVLASLHCLLSAARFQPPEPKEFGNRAVERLLRLAHAQQGVGLNLRAFADVVEALARLRCIYGLSTAPVVNLAISRAQTLEESGHLEGPQLAQLARVMNAVAVVAATASVHSSVLVAATSIWHLLTMRAEALATQAATGNNAAGQQARLWVVPASALLSRLWSTSRLLLAVAKASPSPSFGLPDRLGLVSHAAWLDREQRLVAGLTSAQRRVLAALADLSVPPSKTTLNQSFLEVFPIDVTVHMRMKSGREHQVAILIRDPLKHMTVRTAGGCGASVPLGGEAARESILKASGYHVVALDSHTCLQLPRSLLADELAALMMGDPARSSLRFVA